MEKQEEIDYWKSQFRIISDWKIKYDNGCEYTGQTATGPKIKEATIYSYGKGRPPKDYVFHEILHVCQAEIQRGEGSENYLIRKEKEEKYIQDLCIICKNIMPS